MACVAMALASLVGGIIQPLTGFGAAVVIMIATSAFYDITVAPTVVALICAAQSGAMCWLYRKHIAVRQIALHITLYTVCSITVISLLGNLNLRTLHIAFGAFLVALAVYFLFFAKRVTLKPSLRTGLLCSAFSGCCAGAFTIGGPMMALYFVSNDWDKETYVGNMQFLFLITNTVNFAMRCVHGYFTPTLLPIAAVCIVCILSGLWLGMRLSRRMSGNTARQVVYVAVGISGLITLVEQILK